MLVVTLVVVPDAAETQECEQKELKLVQAVMSGYKKRQVGPDHNRPCQSWYGCTFHRCHLEVRPQAVEVYHTTPACSYHF